jgi:hypothetical protein
MPLVTRPATARDQPFAFAVKRAALGAYVAQVWGWDELAQQAYHAADWARHRPDVVELDGTPIGTLEVVDHHDHLYVGEFYLLPEHQSRGARDGAAASRAGACGRSRRTGQAAVLESEPSPLIV